jgi:alkanesulfonate monooxygenase SsuD/methylene tetrahydromethanopterin reductase-like flavin-dependent oxidoreductase (luciferase family)
VSVCQRQRQPAAGLALLACDIGGMRFAFKTSPQHTTWDAMLEVWVAADDIDVFESGWTFDHFYPIREDHSGPCLEGWITLTALAQATRRVRLGTLVTGIHYRHPAVLANMAATLDIVSAGRLELGIGAGWNEEESGAYGMRGPHRAAVATGDHDLQRQLLPAHRCAL